MHPHSDETRIDVAVVTCRRDLHLLPYMLQSYNLFCKLNGNLIIFHDAIDEDVIRSLSLPPGTRLQRKDLIPGIGPDDFRNQMYIKLNLDNYSEAEYIWSIDCDYLLLKSISAQHFFNGAKPVWLLRDWDGLAGSRWQKPTSEWLGFDVPFQFMDRPQYLLKPDLLRKMRSQFPIERIHDLPQPPSEYAAYAGFCHNFFPDSYDWRIPADDEETLSFSVNQRPPTYCVINPHATLTDAGSSRYCVFWSHWDLAERMMGLFLGDASLRAFGTTAEPSFKPFPRVNVSESRELDLADLLTSDGWLLPDTRFSLPASPASVLRLVLDKPAGPRNHVHCRFRVGSQRTDLYLTDGENDIALPLSADDINEAELELDGGYPEPGGLRHLRARLVRARIDPVGTNTGTEPIFSDQLEQFRERAYLLWNETGLRNVKPMSVRFGEYPEGWDAVIELRRLLTPFASSSVLEFGCGYGRLCRAFSPSAYIGIDINAAAIEKAKSSFSEYDFRVVDYLDEYPPSDLVLMYTVLLHMSTPDVQDLLNKFERSKSTRTLVIAEIMNNENIDSNTKSTYDTESRLHSVLTRTAINYVQMAQVAGFYLYERITKPYHYYSSEIQILIFRRIPSPLSLLNLPDSLANPHLDYSGIFDDGWSGTSLRVLLSQHMGQSSFVVKGMYPAIANEPNEMNCSIYIDDILVSRHVLHPGSIEIRVGVAPCSAIRRIRLEFEPDTYLPKPDGRAIGMLLHSLGFA